MCILIKKELMIKILVYIRINSLHMIRAYNETEGKNTRSDWSKVLISHL